MLDASALIKKHRGRGLFLDTNLLVLLLIGLVNVKRIRTFKRTQNFRVEDFHLVESLVEWFGSPLIATPHVLSQASDLADLSGSERISLIRIFRSTVETVEEKYDAASQLVNSPLFERFGLADASVEAVCRRNVLVVTADVQLQIALPAVGLDALNFNHVRALTP